MRIDRPIFYQNWNHLLFLHWKVPAEVIQERLPEGLKVDLWNGSAYLGIIPFMMEGLRPSFAFALPCISNFMEINLRTYVRDKHNRPGVWFFSLDTNNTFGNWIARKFFHLNYRYAETVFTNHSKDSYECSVSFPETNMSIQRFKWIESKETFLPSKDPELLEFFLTERYRLFTFSKKNNQLFSGRIAHEPYSLNVPTLEAFDTGLISHNIMNISVINTPDSILSSQGTKVKVFPLSKVI
mgnify:CR=1 FL=1|tara:strand:+ start:73 stop:792 length:720 start_codon:yes stop_codon:yes gene_type:complete